MSTLKDRIYNVIFTRKGEVPYRPHFGSSIFEHLDKPLDVAIPNIKREIIDSINKNITSVSVVKVTNVGLEFTIHYADADANEDSLIIDIHKVLRTQVIKSSYNTASVFTLNLIYEGNSINTPVLSADDLIIWLRENWSAYGQWYLVKYNTTIILETSLSDIKINIINA